MAADEKDGYLRSTAEKYSGADEKDGYLRTTAEKEVAAGVYYHGLSIQGVGELALCDVGSNPLRFRKGDTTYGMELVATDDPNASAIRVKTGAGIKAVRSYT